jgi:glc operon protein GlcG
LFKKPTSFFEGVINKGRTAMAALPSLPDFTPLQGGVPIVIDGQVIGAVGVSGAASAKQDEEIATIAAAAVEPTMAGMAMTTAAPPTPTTTYFNHGAVAAAFAQGEPLLEVPGYKVHASRRDGPGMAEVHLWETDVVYVAEGTATLITGGTTLDPEEIEPGQIRGTSIEGGEAHPLAKGDVIVIPNGVPHWFKEVQAPFIYFVVKPIAPKGDVS